MKNENKKSEKKPFALEFLETMNEDEQLDTNGGRHRNPHKYHTMMASFIDPKTGKVTGDF